MGDRRSSTIPAPHSFSSPPLFPTAPAQQLNKFVSHLLAPPTHAVYSLYIASRLAPGILSLRRRGSRGWASAPCRGHWQQRQVGRPLQRGGGPGAEFFGQPIKILISTFLQLHFAAFCPTSGALSAYANTLAAKAAYSVSTSLRYEDWARAKRRLYVAFSLPAESTGYSVVSPSLHKLGERSRACNSRFEVGNITIRHWSWLRQGSRVRGLWNEPAKRSRQSV